MEQNGDNHADDKFNNIYWSNLKFDMVFWWNGPQNHNSALG